jgi:GDP-L-fucose synthase
MTCRSGTRTKWDRPGTSASQFSWGRPGVLAKYIGRVSWWKGKRVTVTGGRGFLGRPVLEMLQKAAADASTFSSTDYDLTQQSDVSRMYRDLKPEVVIHLAARVGGIGANRDNPGKFFYDNAIMGIELMDQARRNGVAKFVQIGTVCSYPKFAPVPFSEDDLWNGYPEETNAPYGLAKKMLLVQAQAYRQQYGLNAIYLIPVNLYGPGDNFDLHTSHVIPALIRKCLEAKHAGAKAVEVWGTGSPTREFLYVEDAARAIMLAAERYDQPDPVNVGTSDEISVKDLVALVAELTGFEGEIIYDTTKPDGQPRRKLDVERAKVGFGFVAEIPFRVGLQRTIDWFESRLGAIA